MQSPLRTQPSSHTLRIVRRALVTGTLSHFGGQSGLPFGALSGMRTNRLYAPQLRRAGQNFHRQENRAIPALQRVCFEGEILAGSGRYGQNTAIAMYLE